MLLNLNKYELQKCFDIKVELKFQTVGGQWEKCDKNMSGLFRNKRKYIVFKPMEDNHRMRKTWSFQQKAGKGEDSKHKIQW